MKMRRVVFLGAAALMCATAVVRAAPQSMSVQVRNGQLRATASFLGQVVAQVGYGDQVNVVQQQGAWYQVRTASDQIGWINQSALSAKKIVMRAGDEDVKTGASGEELALAGKGFNSDVEAEFKSQNRNIDFTWVDKMEKMTEEPSDLAKFLKDGAVISQR